MAAVLSLAVLVAVVLLAVTSAWRNQDEVPEVPFPPYWSEIEEGETTKQDLHARLGRPTRVEGECFLYHRLVESQNYKFCFAGDTLLLKAAY